jgi:uncharacterized repeat protein (TIGR02543 family)
VTVTVYDFTGTSFGPYSAYSSTVYTDLGSGTSYTSFSCTAAAWYPSSTTYYTLATQARTDLQNNLGVDRFQVGYSITSASEWKRFGTTTGTFHQIQVTYSSNVSLTVASSYGSPNPAVGTHNYSSGTSVTCSVSSPVAGATGVRYVCTGWTGTGSVAASGTGTTTTFTINANSTITWNWQTQYQLTTGASPAGAGTVATSPVGPWFPSGQSVTATASPGTGYQFSNWSGAMTSSNNPDTFSMTGPLTLTANFSALQLTLLVASSYGSPSPPAGSNTFSYGTSVTCTVPSPVAGPAGTRYSCTGWAGSGSAPASGAGLSTTFTITANSTLTWNWQTEYQVSAVESPAGSGSVVLAPPGGWYAAGSSVSLQANPATGYNFTGWSGGLTGTTNPASVTVNAPVSATAGFQPIGPSLTVASAYGSPAPPTGLQAYFAGTRVDCSVASPVDGAPGVRYVCTGWAGTGDVPSSGTGTSFSVTLNNNSSVTWTWRTEYSLAVSPSPAAGGTVSSDPSGPWIAAGTSASLSASPAAGYSFLSWSGGLSSADNPARVRMDGPLTATGNFLADLGLGVAAGPANPGASNESPSASSVPVLQALLRAGPSEDVRVATLTLRVSGPSNESATVAAARLYVDADADGSFNVAVDTPVGGPGAFSSDDGFVTFTALPPLRVPAGGTLTLLATFDLAASAGDAFQARFASSADVSAAGWDSGTPVTAGGLPVEGGWKTAAGAGSAGSLLVSRGVRTPAARRVRPGTADVPVLQVLLRASSLEGAVVNSLTVSAMGSGDDAGGILAARLYADADGDGALGAGDSLLSNGGAFSSDDGTVTFSGLARTISAGAPPAAWLVTVDLAPGAGGEFVFGVVAAADVGAVGASSAASLTASGPPLWGLAILAEPGDFEPAWFIGGCGAAPAGTAPLWPPLLALAAALLAVRRRARRGV